MARKILRQRSFFGGISEAEKEGLRGASSFLEKLNIFGDPGQVTIQPTTAKVSGTVVVDLVKWMVMGTPHDTNLWAYGDGGRIYKATTGGSGTWTVER
ncbi:MAG: hypothetical protein QME66_04140, partial [Candidatus Eisenbacteria bacterium]|nr:hypothetical protein [Candidatus Eisenbacteria bacterium]